MRVAALVYPTDRGPDVVEVGRAVEERGFESLFFPEHTHIPTSRESAWPGGAELPDYYSRLLDPFVALAAVAVTTERLKLGTGVCLVVERDPIITAKEVATLDQLSGGRFLFGVGAGWNREEMQNHGTDPRTRMRLLAERVEAMRAIWTQDEASYHGQHVTFEPLWSWPKPVQRPHPPVLVGGVGPTAIDRVLAFGDEWMPNRVGDDTEAFRRRIEELQARAADIGRGSVPVTLFGAPREVDVLRQYAEMGVHRCVFRVPGESRDAFLRELDLVAGLVAGHED